MATPVSITVEGANILTRNLMIFGQGATRCHPYVLEEMKAAANPDEEQGMRDFDRLLVKHIKFAVSNVFGSLWMGLSGSRFNETPVSGETARYYQHLTRMSRGLAMASDISMLMLGGDLKRKEMISARLGDVLSHLYMASAVLKRFEEEGRQAADLPYVHYAVQHHLHKIGQAFDGFFRNFPNRPVAWAMRVLVFPLGNHFSQPADELLQDISSDMMKPGVTRDRHTFLCYWKEEESDPTGHMEMAFLSMLKLKDVYKTLRKAQKRGELSANLNGQELADAALEKGLVDKDTAEELARTERLRLTAIGVDSFAPGIIEHNQFYTTKGELRKAAVRD